MAFKYTTEYSNGTILTFFSRKSLNHWFEYFSDVWAESLSSLKNHERYCGEQQYYSHSWTTAGQVRLQRWMGRYLNPRSANTEKQSRPQHSSCFRKMFLTSNNRHPQGPFLLYKELIYITVVTVVHEISNYIYTFWSIICYMQSV